MDINLANRVNNLCVDFFNNLPKTGKPILNQEWTVLTCFVQKTNDNLEVVSLGTGTKCLGQHQLSTRGDILNDSHAEVMARRGFVRYLYHEIRKTKNNDSIFELSHINDRFKLKENINFLIFTTHSPCGDASIFPRENNCDEPDRKKPKIDSSDDYGKVFTGAKIFNTKECDRFDPMIQDEGKLRIKPGRGIRTLSMSCSDKIAKWCVTGVQGALLMSILESPIFVDGLIFQVNTVCDIKASKRAFYERFDENNLVDGLFKLHKIEVFEASEGKQFGFVKSEQNTDLRACPTSTVWCKVPRRYLHFNLFL